MKHLIWLINNEKPFDFTMTLLLFCPMFIISNALMLFWMMLGRRRADLLKILDFDIYQYCISNNKDPEEMEHLYKFWMNLP